MCVVLKLAAVGHVQLINLPGWDRGATQAYLHCTRTLSKPLNCQPKRNAHILIQMAALNSRKSGTRNASVFQVLS